MILGRYFEDGVRFNPRARVGRDGSRSRVHTTLERFNPRARVGRDRLGSFVRHLRRSFNPRARVGRDQKRRQKRKMPIAFQSTRPRGARRVYQVSAMVQVVSFNPRARVGRDYITLNYEQIEIYCTIRANPSLTFRCTALSH